MWCVEASSNCSAELGPTSGWGVLAELQRFSQATVAEFHYFVGALRGSGIGKSGIAEG